MDLPRTTGPLAGDPPSGAIPRLLELHGGQIYHLGLKLCGSREDAEDVVQETFLQAWRKWHQFEGRSSASTWLFTIASRVCRRMHRRRAGEPHHMASLEDLLPFGETRMAVLPSPDDPPLRAQIRRESRERVEEAILGLPVAYRLPLVLKDILGLEIADIAAALNLKPATVKTRVHRARLRVRQHLERALPSRDGPPAAYAKRICLDLLQAKQESLDRGDSFPVKDEILCERCESVFSTLDLAREICREIAGGALPEKLRRSLLARLEEQSATAR